MIKSIIKEIIDKLRNNGYDVYEPSQHKGECTEPYIVVKLDGATDLLGISSERPIYTIMCYVPKNRYSVLEQMAYDCKRVLKQMHPMIMYAGNETPSIYDETVKGHMVSFQYQGIRKNF